MFPFSRRRLPPRALGPLGERRAVWFYRWRGYSIVARNLRTRGGEIDLVVRRGRVVAFVEVKTRQSRSAGTPQEAVDLRKQGRMALAAERLVRSLGLEGLECRYDVLSLYWTGRRFRAEHFPGAFEIVDTPGRAGL
jgi:putative endonuclease